MMPTGSLVGTTVFLIRHGVTEWHSNQRVLGRRDIALTEEGHAQAERAANLLAQVPLVDVIASPLQRTLQTAERIAAPHGIQVARDPRLVDFDLGEWSGMEYSQITATPAYQRFVSDPMSTRIPGGETLLDARKRALASIHQALRDSPSGDAIALVTHAGIIRIVLTHYLGSPPGNYHRLRVSPGSISVLYFEDVRELPRILAVNHGASVGQLLHTLQPDGDDGDGTDA